jgi:hypothetical protein
MTIEEDMVAEGRRLATLGLERQLGLKLIGGVAVALACPEALTRAELRRPYKDIDFAAPRSRAKGVLELLSAEGYTPDRAFNALHGATRLLIFDTARGRQIDVFLDEFEMCHHLDLRSRLSNPWPHLAPSDLLLMKLQVRQLNEKDAIDAIALVLQHDCAEEDGDGSFDTAYIARICGGDWGWYTTVCDSMELVRQHSARILTHGADADVVGSRLARLRQILEDTPKSARWKLRARVGRRVKWYEIPDEVG